MFKKNTFFLRRGMDSSIQVNEHFLTFAPFSSKRVITDFVQIVETEQIVVHQFYPLHRQLFVRY